MYTFISVRVYHLNIRFTCKAVGPFVYPGTIPTCTNEAEIVNEFVRRPGRRVVFVCRRRKSSAAHPRDSRGNGFKNKFRQTNFARPIIHTRARALFTPSRLALLVIVFCLRTRVPLPRPTSADVIEDIMIILLLLTLSLHAVAINNEFFVFVHFSPPVAFVKSLFYTCTPQHYVLCLPRDLPIYSVQCDTNNEQCLFQ